jgi:hypothetical protein
MLQRASYCHMVDGRWRRYGYRYACETTTLSVLALPAVNWLASRRRQRVALEVTVGERS